MSLLNLSEIPGYAEALKRERETRDLAFCDWPVPLCGLKVNQFTLMHLLILGNCDNAFVGGRLPKVEDVAFFLWVVSPQYAPNAPKARDRFIKTIRKRVKFFAACAEIGEYMDGAFQDSPHAGNVADAKSYTSFAATYCDLFASEYGWDDALTMRKPMARLFQLYRRIQQRAKPRAVMFNPSDGVLSKYLRQQAGGQT